MQRTATATKQGSIEGGASGGPIFSEAYDVVVGIVVAGRDGHCGEKYGHSMSKIILKIKSKIS